MNPLPEDEDTGGGSGLGRDATEGARGGGNSSPASGQSPSSMAELLQPVEEAPRNEIVPHDCFRQVYLGQISDPLFPAHPAPPEAEEDELTRAALEDPDALNPDPESTAPTFWRFLAIVFFAVVALGIVFMIK